ncbi:hypothetical protein COU57_01235 [Candidatus Pacearchaeota archaeon CG10_big_fil_rev_8_21_14_0_10_32_14]|nr:MAG: hypothetical protein COU57_01235 [Candidatus Pacearchaeota archaeon CG10_big_fil_rev_8_21_14_0_10_32_14]
MTNKFLIFNLEDDKAKALGEVISNPTCKKIVDYIAEHNDVSESDIVKALGIPANTVNYNIKRLINSGLIETSKTFFWSKKGKKMATYRVANKIIVISPKKSSNVYSKLKGIVPAVFVSGILSVALGFYYNSRFVVKSATRTVTNPQMYDTTVLEVAKTSGAADFAMQAIPQVPSVAIKSPEILGIPQISVWFFVGALVAISAYSIWNWKRM